MWLDTITAIYLQEQNREPANFEEAHYLYCITELGYQAEDILREVSALPKPPPYVVPDKDTTLRSMQGDICMLDNDGGSYEGWGTWEALNWSDEKYKEFAARYPFKMVPCSMRVRDYLDADFDLTQNLPLLRERVIRSLTYGHIPMLDFDCYDENGRGAESVARLPEIFGYIKDVLPAYFSVWELVVDGSPARFTHDENIQGYKVARDIIPNAVAGIEFNAITGRREPVIHDGRSGLGSHDWWRMYGYLFDVLLMRMPYELLDDMHAFCDEFGGALCRVGGAFSLPKYWPEGGEIPESVLANWQGDYGVYKVVSLFEYASAEKYSSEKKRQIREYVTKTFGFLESFGEG